MDEELVLETVVPGVDDDACRAIRVLLTSRDLEPDQDIELFVAARRGDRVVGVTGLVGNVIRCTAVSETEEGSCVLLALMQEMAYVALERGRAHLFLYTKPQYREVFESCGFHTIAAVPQAVLMENTPFGIHAYAERLSELRRLRPKIGAVVVNANPFTRGHQYLIQHAAQDCDYLHVFVVREESSLIPYADRLALVRAGVDELPERDCILVHPGSDYMVSKATFPTYFLKEDARVTAAATGIDLLLFREHIAPALGITHRYVGTEPFCHVTRQYNEDMHYWLESSCSAAPPITVVEVPRVASDGRAISATDVRRRALSGDLTGLDQIVPPATLAYLTDHFSHHQPLEV